MLFFLGFEEEYYNFALVLLTDDNCALAPDDSCGASFLLETAASDDNDCVVVDAGDLLLAAEVADNDYTVLLAAALGDDDLVLVLAYEPLLLEGIKSAIACCLLLSGMLI